MYPLHTRYDDVEIKGDPYVLVWVAPGLWNLHKVNAWDETIYSIERMRTHYRCTCMGYAMRNECKHINFLKEYLKKEERVNQ